MIGDLDITLKNMVYLPPDTRRQYDFTSGAVKKKKRKKPLYKKRRVWSRDELIQYLKDTGFDSQRKLTKGRGRTDPCITDYTSIFGKWSNAKKLAFGEPIKFDFVEKDAAYLVKVVIEFGLWKSKQWQEARKNNKAVIPPMKKVIDEWGSFSNMRGYAYQVCMSSVIERYVSLWRKLGKKPTLVDCKEEKINLDIAVDHFESKRELDKFLSGLGI